jgi:hypothetical protein
MGTKRNHPFAGTWHIYEMEMWDEDYFNMERQAFIEIKANDLGNFQFGLVIATLEGQLEGDDYFSFDWEGSAEMDEAHGTGWLELKGEGELEGLFEFDGGDESGFKAKRSI